MDDPANDVQEDALTHFLARVRFDARIFNHRKFCGDWAIDIIDAALVERETDYPGRTVALCDLARLLLLHLLRGRFAEAPSTGYLAALGDPQISRALLLIHSRYGEDWTLENLAKEAGMSRTSFENRFHDYVGMPPARYLTAWRMQEATELLEGTRISIGQIAEQLWLSLPLRFAYSA